MIFITFITSDILYITNIYITILTQKFTPVSNVSRLNVSVSSEILLTPSGETKSLLCKSHVGCKSRLVNLKSDLKY